MKKIIFIIGLLLGILLANKVFSQETDFKVLLSKNATCYISTEPETPIQRSGSIHKLHIIKIGTGGYIAMLHRTGKTIEIKTPGVYPVEKLLLNLSTKTMSFTEKYSANMRNHLHNNPDMQESFDIAGVVTRGTIKYDSLYNFIINEDSVSCLDYFIAGDLFESVNTIEHAGMMYELCYRLCPDISEYKQCLLNFKRKHE